MQWMTSPGDKSQLYFKTRSKHVENHALYGLGAGDRPPVPSCGHELNIRVALQRAHDACPEIPSCSKDDYAHSRCVVRYAASGSRSARRDLTCALACLISPRRLIGELAGEPVCHPRQEKHSDSEYGPKDGHFPGDGSRWRQ